MTWAIAIHGGAGSRPSKLGDELRAEYERSLEAALRHGQAMLKQGDAALDVVEQVIRRMEDDPLFNAGRGAALNAAGGFELDASIMDGRERACGAVAGVRTVRNPISLARRVMQDTRHVLLSGEGADQFAARLGVEEVAQDYFRTERQQQAWRRWIEKQKQPDPASQDGSTVGCVARDQNGNLAAGTSTGGLMGKLYGRIGDSPIIAAGTFADNETCAVSCTGIGEEFIRNAVAYDVSARVAYKNVSLAEAARQIIHHQLQPDSGGLIAVGKDGAIAIEFNTRGMFHGSADSEGKFEIGFGKESPAEDEHR